MSRKARTPSIVRAKDPVRSVFSGLLLVYVPLIGVVITWLLSGECDVLGPFGN